ncbi:hypothetical protein AN216_18070 [Streptomyces oceani]|uniref:Aromatic ring-opening dioxygenase LigA n=1 Tax=Streptomyces oceani TaxID=1075402 RepID=A0A1E7JZ45_9ACTN|nr:hypothetical protein AN216_18070 [Streptomyces oceani]
MAGCAPYICLKIAWICGSGVGIPADSWLLDPAHVTTMRLVNAGTVLMDAAVIVLALLFTRPWGRRTPAWLPVLPAWFATGLLAPVMLGFLAQSLFGSGTSRPAGEPEFLEDWVFLVVYTGFVVQGLALSGLFVSYARTRWSHLWRGPTGGAHAVHRAEPATKPALRVTAVAAALLAVLPLCAHLVWATGSTVGLSPHLAESRDGGLYTNALVDAVLLASAMTGTLLLAFPPRPYGTRVRIPLALPLALTWVGSAALVCWGGWTSVTALNGDGPASSTSALMSLTYAVQMSVGVCVSTIGAHFLAERAALRSREAG